jgi:hypothetical protein
MHQGDMHQGDMHQGDMHQGDMHQGDMHQGDMHQGDMHQVSTVMHITFIGGTYIFYISPSGQYYDNITDGCLTMAVYSPNIIELSTLHGLIECHTASVLPSRTFGYIYAKLGIAVAKVLGFTKMTCLDGSYKYFLDRKYLLKGINLLTKGMTYYEALGFHSIDPTYPQMKMLMSQMTPRDIISRTSDMRDYVSRRIKAPKEQINQIIAIYIAEIKDHMDTPILTINQKLAENGFLYGLVIEIICRSGLIFNSQFTTLVNTVIKMASEMELDLT